VALPCPRADAEDVEGVKEVIENWPAGSAVARAPTGSAVATVVASATARMPPSIMVDGSRIGQVNRNPLPRVILGFSKPANR